MKMGLSASIGILLKFSNAKYRKIVLFDGGAGDRGKAVWFN